jgi:pilus assembly protein CpaC
MLLSFAPFSWASDTIVLTLGQQKTIKAPGVSRIAVGNPSVADVNAIEKSEQVLITAKGVGKTNVIVWDSDNRERSILIEVIATDPEQVSKEIKELLGDIEGIKIKPVGKRVVIDGYILKKEDLDKIKKITALYPGVMNLTTLSPKVIDLVVEHINKEFAASGWTKSRAKKMADHIVLEGDVSSEEIKQKAEIIAKAYDPKTINFLKVGVEIQQLININIDFIELNNNDRTKVGIDWGDGLTVQAPLIGGGAFGSGLSSALTGSYGIIANYGVTINAIKGKKRSRILAQPKLLCRSGEKAEFLAGGEVAIPLITQETSSVEYKQYGMILKIAPTADSGGNIETAIEIENSTISDFNMSGAPNLHTSRVSTFVNGQNGQTIVLSGVFSKNNTKGTDKVPLMGDIPILGELFKSRSFQNEESELLIFVTLAIVNNETAEKPAEAIRMQQKYDNEAENLNFELLD